MARHAVRPRRSPEPSGGPGAPRTIGGGAPPPRIRAVLFDLFDTLVDLPMEELPRHPMRGREIPTTAGAVHAALVRHVPIEFADFSAALLEVDAAWRDEYWAQGRELPTSERFARLLARLALADPGGAVAAELTAAHMDLLAALVRTPAHHGAVLDALRRRVRIGLCSNWSWTPTALTILDASGLRGRLDAVAVSHDVGVRKPRPEIFENVLAALGVAPSEALHVGDNLAADVAGAAALGIRTVWITRRVPDPEAARARTPDARPDWTVRDLAELEAILDRLEA
jgi:FMN phosphatase YigB (HAD superfamily)